MVKLLRLVADGDLVRSQREVTGAEPRLHDPNPLKAFTLVSPSPLHQIPQIRLKR